MSEAITRQICLKLKVISTNHALKEVLTKGQHVSPYLGQQFYHVFKQISRAKVTVVIKVEFGHKTRNPPKL
jgi:hypothetical protein